MQIEDKDVLHIAKLARLKLADNELENYKKNLQEILDFAMLSKPKEANQNNKVKQEPQEYNLGSFFNAIKNL